MTSSAAAELGQVLGGRWRVVALLGAGGQGRTFIARDEKAPGVGERLVVVKALRLGEGGWKRFDLFEREARVLAQLDHPGIPRYVDRIEGEGGTFYLVMERAPGETLRDLGKERRFDEPELKALMEGVLDILAYLHGRNPPVVHRDVKPANLLRAEDGKVSLVDYGGVRAALAEEGGSTVVGTYGYMAPEQLHGEATPRTDLYGLGATIVALAGGVEPDRIPRRGLKMDLGRHLPRMAPHLREILQQMVDPDPEKRPASAAEVRRRLAEEPPARPERPDRRAVIPAPVATAKPAPATVTDEHEDDLIAELDELRVPAPIRWLLRMTFGLVGIAGHLALSVVAMVIIPIVFSVARAFTGKSGDARLHDTERRVKGALRESRRSFRALQQRAFRPRPRQEKLPPAPQRPRLPRRRR